MSASSLTRCTFVLPSSGESCLTQFRLLTAFVPLAAPLTVIGLVSARPLVRFSTIITCVFVYAVSLFVALSEILTRFGGGAALTRWRGQKWVKELDYVHFEQLGLTRD